MKEGKIDRKEKLEQIKKTERYSLFFHFLPPSLPLYASRQSLLTPPLHPGLDSDPQPSSSPPPPPGIGAKRVSWGGGCLTPCLPGGLAARHGRPGRVRHRQTGGKGGVARRVEAGWEEGRGSQQSPGEGNMEGGGGEGDKPQQQQGSGMGR
ncbi:hypothetical protein Pcinc_025482 [Petrolisthes cinctipes]|uniref:Uncharacterized protein n=1 Tax=Petrolisthes cinctipes TaxID=88211 RepID=A0AAE1KBV6_PETCI|nr:hypothetical protein Pcinc_025482 [Petrolisthes cinctipes]